MVDLFFDIDQDCSDNTQFIGICFFAIDSDDFWGILCITLAYKSWFCQIGNISHDIFNTRYTIAA